MCNVFIFGKPEIGTQRELIDNKREYTIWQKTQVNLELDIAPFFEVKPKLIALIIEEDENQTVIKEGKKIGK